VVEKTKPALRYSLCRPKDSNRNPNK